MIQWTGDLSTPAEWPEPPDDGTVFETYGSQACGMLPGPGVDELYVFCSLPWKIFNGWEGGGVSGPKISFQTLPCPFLAFAGMSAASLSLKRSFNFDIL